MSVSTQDRLAFLRQPELYGVAAGRVELIETHMSWVFLAGDYACKLKKPVRTEYLDFRNTEQRCHFCAEELRLNRRMAPGIYLRTDALSLDTQGQLHLGTDGETVDCVVWMRRLPESALLSHALLHQRADTALMQHIAACVAAFHRSLPGITVDLDDWIQRLDSEIARNEAVLLAHPATASATEVHALCGAQRDWLRPHVPWIEARIRQRHIVEGHGDLRAEHVYVNESIGAIDCLEFSQALRTLDTADEISFLALDCERLHAPAMADELLRAYCQAAQDSPPAELIHFYQSLRAAIRARLAAEHLDDDALRYSSHWIRRTREWLDLALRHQSCISATMEPPA